ncbi:MAG: hypothetical protein JO121_08135 [Deltaproteobacteria bacterium]|nr:hypothetical protein [Deltaproteobacteria bacterium]
MPSPTQKYSMYARRFQYPNVTLLTNAQVVKLNTNATGTAVTEVVVCRGLLALNRRSAEPG